jgi:hypothetical protein
MQQRCCKGPTAYDTALFYELLNALRGGGGDGSKEQEQEPHPHCKKLPRGLKLEAQRAVPPTALHSSTTVKCQYLLYCTGNVYCNKRCCALPVYCVHNSIVLC